MFVDPLFHDRVEAGQVLSGKLKTLVFNTKPLVLALPRGGVPVASQIAHALHADLDILLVRKIGVPGEEELAMGAIASGGTRVLNGALIEYLGISSAAIEEATTREKREIERRERLYREGRPVSPIKGRTVILVDDGLATGATMLAAVQVVQAQHPERVIVAVPVAARSTCEEFRQHVDDVVCAQTPEPFYGVGAWYENFAPTSDADVQKLLREAFHEQVI